MLGVFTLWWVMDRLLFLLVLACADSAPPDKQSEDTGKADNDVSIDSEDSTVEHSDTDSPDPTTTPTDTVDSAETGDSSTDTTPPPVEGRGTILLIGDGMGLAQLEAGGWYRTGSPYGLTVWTLPHQARLNTCSASGVTDSAASATTMATGEATFNGRIGMDRALEPVENLVELSRSLGLATGVVTTTSVQHATPAAFTAHHPDRNQQIPIADQQVLESGVDVMLGGGTAWLNPAGTTSRRVDEGLIDAIADAGYRYVTTADALAEIDPKGGRLWGAFAVEHLPYVLDRPPEVPSLPTMVDKALDVLVTDPDGFFLVVEAGRIDHAGHGNNVGRLVEEVVELDQTVELLLAWVDEHPDTSVIVTADHECGGLEIVSGADAGELPEVTWLWGAHTSNHVQAFGIGPGTEGLADLEGHHRDVYALLRARVTGEPVEAPVVVPLPDGDMRDLPHEVARQVNPTSFGEGYNQLDALHIGVDPWGLIIGIEGLFELESNAVVVLLDVDRVAGSGHTELFGVLADPSVGLDLVLSSIHLLAPFSVPTWGADFAAGSVGGSEVYALSPLAGLRELQPVEDLPWLSAGVVFGPGVRVEDGPVAAVPGMGLELGLAWQDLYPELEGGVPPHAEIALAAILVNSTGFYASNQALPPFPEGMLESPGDRAVPLPGVVVVPVDSDGDGLADGAGTPWLE